MKNFTRYIGIKQNEVASKHFKNFLNLTSIYQTLNFKISIKITVANLLNHKKQNYLFIQK